MLGDTVYPTLFSLGSNRGASSVEIPNEEGR